MSSFVGPKRVERHAESTFQPAMLEPSLVRKSPWRVCVQKCTWWCVSVSGRGSPHVQNREREPLRLAAWALPAVPALGAMSPDT